MLGSKGYTFYVQLLDVGMVRYFPTLARNQGFRKSENDNLLWKLWERAPDVAGRNRAGFTTLCAFWFVGPNFHTLVPKNRQQTFVWNEGILDPRLWLMASSCILACS